MKIADDESKSVPEKLQLIESRVDDIDSKQSAFSEKMKKLNQILTNVQSNLEKSSGNGDKLSHLNNKISGIKQDIELLTKISSSNEEEVKNITNILASLNITTSDHVDHSTTKSKKTQDSSQWVPLNSDGRP